MKAEDIRSLCRAGKIRWSAHAAARMRQRGILRADVLDCIMTGEIIEQYPENWLNPACLMMSCAANGKTLHVVVGMDDWLHIVTAYFPDEKTFLPDMKTRRK